MKKILVLLSILLLILGGCTSQPVQHGFPPPAGYSSWDEYYGSSQTTTTSTTTTITLHASIGFTGTQFTIMNCDLFDWINVKFILNSNDLDAGYSFITSLIEANTLYTVGAAWFAKADGTRFIPSTMKPLQIIITCKTLEGADCYYWCSLQHQKGQIIITGVVWIKEETIGRITCVDTFKNVMHIQIHRLRSGAGFLIRTVDLLKKARRESDGKNNE